MMLNFKGDAMKKMIQISILLSALFVLASCDDIDTPNGEIPAKYLDLAKQYEGVYVGVFNGVKGELTIKLNGNKPELSFSGEEGTDILDRDCKSQFGDLKSINGSNDDGKLTLETAVFNFDPNLCRRLVQDRSIRLNFENGGKKIEASMLQYLRTRQVCDVVGFPPTQRCRDEVDSRYLYGDFRKK